MNSNYLKTLRLTYFALAMGIVLFMVVTILVKSINGPLAENDISVTQRAPFIIVLILITGVALMVYRTVFHKKLLAIRTLPSLDKKLAAWRELSMLQGALIEAPSFFALVLFMLLGINVLLVWPVAGLILFWISQPTRDKLINELTLTPNEISEFDSLS